MSGLSRQSLWKQSQLQLTRAHGTAVGASIGYLTTETSSTTNGTVPELVEALSDDTTTTESTEIVATPPEGLPLLLYSNTITLSHHNLLQSLTNRNGLKMMMQPG